MTTLVCFIALVVGLSINIYFACTRNKIGRGVKFANELIQLCNVVMATCLLIMINTGVDLQKGRLQSKKQLEDSIIYRKGYNQALEDVKKDSIK